MADIVGYLGGNGTHGVNANEMILTQANVNSNTFGKLFSRTVQGQIYAQPVVVQNVSINGASHDIVIVATEHDQIYAFDANGNGSSALWHVDLLDKSKNSYLDPSSTVTTVPTSEIDALVGGYKDITTEIGITSTPVVEKSSNTLYVVAKTKEVRGGVSHYVHRLHALNLSTGAEKFGGPTVIADTTKTSGPTSARINATDYIFGPTVVSPQTASTPSTDIPDGSFKDSDGIYRIHFNGVFALQRSALSLINGKIYVGFASEGDLTPYHGWIVGYDGHTLQQTAVFNTTPNGQSSLLTHDSTDDPQAGGGIWLSGAPITADTAGNLYLVTSNGTFDMTLTGSGFPVDGDFGDSILKLGIDSSSTASNQNGNKNGWGLKVLDYFTPNDEEQLTAKDIDLGSGGVLILPDGAGGSTHPNLAIFGGKNGKLYVVDRDTGKLGKFDPSANHVVQVLDLSGGKGFRVFDTPAYFNGKVYVQLTQQGGSAPIADDLRAFTVNSNGTLSAAGKGPTSDGTFTGSTPFITAPSQTSNGIVWTVQRNAANTNATLNAFATSNISSYLYRSSDVPAEDTPAGPAMKFAVPVVANGKVYVISNGHLDVYGLLANPRDGSGNQAPVANNDKAVASPPGTSTFKTVTIDVLANDVDPDGDPLSIVPGSISGNTGTVSIVNGKLQYTAKSLSNPKGEFFDTFTYKASDGKTTTTASVTVHVFNPILSRILINNFHGWTLSTDSDQPITMTAVIDPNDPATIDLTKTATFTSSEPIIVRFWRASGANEFFNLSHEELTNGRSGQTMTGFKLEVLDANDQPRPEPVTPVHTDVPHVHVLGGFTANVFTTQTETDGIQQILYTGGQLATGGIFKADNVGRLHDKTFDYFDLGETGVFQTSGGGGTGPTARNDSASVKPSNDVHVHVLSNDTGSGLKITSVNKPSHGTTKINTRGTSDPSDDFVEYVPSYGYHGTDSFKYTITDKNGKTAQATVNVTVIPGVGVGTDPRTKQSALDVFGTPSGDKITLTGATGGINVSFNGSNLGFFKFAGGAFIDAAGGHDTVKVVNSGRSFVMWGGTGNDLLVGGTGRDALFGGIGADALFGNGGGDWLVGGRNADNLSGSDSTDILVAGTTDFDNDLSAQLGLNKASSLNSSNTHDDSDEDHLTGGPGTDILFANRSGGVVKDLIFGASDQLHELLA